MTELDAGQKRYPGARGQNALDQSAGVAEELKE